MTRTRSHRLTLLLAALLVATAACGSGATVRDVVTVGLPEPTGEFPVGVVDLHLRDPDRIGPDNRPGRDIMISLWYPARTDADEPQAPWLPEPTTKHLFDELQSSGGVPPDRWRLAPLTARYGASAAGSPPQTLVLISPGYGLIRGLYAGLAQDLASRGHIVAVVDHPGDAGLVALPDGRVQPRVPLDQDDRSAIRASITTRADDLRFVLDQLHQLHTGALGNDADGQTLPTDLTGLIVTSHAAGIGHSFGGPAVMTAITADPRITTGINLDGSLFPPVTTGIPQPVLVVASDGHLLTKDPSWHQWCTGDHPPAAAVMLSGAAHLSFTDLTAILPALRAANLITSASTINTIGSIDPRVSRRAQTSVIATWLSRRSPLDFTHPTVPIRPLPACLPDPSALSGYGR